MRRPAAGIGFLFTTFIFMITGLTAQDAPPVETQYGDYDRLVLPPFYLSNDIWGRFTIKDYEQFTFRTDAAARFPAGWQWRWPAVNRRQVKAYPNIGFGCGPFDERSTSPWLPRRIGDLEEVTVRYDFSQRATGVYDFAFDLWITRTPGVTSPPEINIVREVMIWLDASGVKPDVGPFMETVTIDGEAYDFYLAKNNVLDFAGKYRRDYMAFLKKTPEYKGMTRITEFFKYLLKKRYILPAEYMRNISLGNEAWHGSGKTVINDYSITLRAAGGVGGVTPADRIRSDRPAIVLGAGEAALQTGAQLRYEESGDGGNIGWWTSLQDEIRWDMTIPQNGEYAVTALMSCDPPFRGSTVNIIVDKQTISFNVPDTGSWQTYREVPLGNLRLKKGKHSVALRAAAVADQFVGNVREVRVYPQP